MKIFLVFVYLLPLFMSGFTAPTFGIGQSGLLIIDDSDTGTITESKMDRGSLITTSTNIQDTKSQSPQMVFFDIFSSDDGTKIMGWDCSAFGISMTNSPGCLEFKERFSGVTKSFQESKVFTSVGTAVVLEEGKQNILVWMQMKQDVKKHLSDLLPSPPLSQNENTEVKDGTIVIIPIVDETVPEEMDNGITYNVVGLGDEGDSLIADETKWCDVCVRISQSLGFSFRDNTDFLDDCAIRLSIKRLPVSVCDNVLTSQIDDY